MAERVRRHQADRPAGWATIEEPLDLPRALKQATNAGSRAVIIDCLTLWLYNATEQGWSDGDIEVAAEATARGAQNLDARVIAVTNEVGWGIVPASEAGRRFRDLQGRVSQLWAAAAGEVIFVVAGLPIHLKKQDA
jgi:adenosyl cobinamide kinase/adenosyl cobinamide phosphate guanylyltransferase